MPTVAVDTSFRYIARTGMTRYIDCLLDAMRTLAPEDVEIQEIGFRTENYDYRQPRRMLTTLTREYIWQPWIAPLSLRQKKCALLHSTFSACFGIPRGVRHVATIHDLSPIRTPDRYRPWSRYRALLDYKAAAKADQILCVSESTANDVMHFLNLPASKITITPLASSFSSESPETPPSTPLPTRFFLFVGSLESGKNLQLLADVYRLAEQKSQDILPLVIVGSRIPNGREEKRPSKNWLYLGRQSDLALTFLYRRARALIFPSKNEGFGLPVVEAMSLGCPVICSNLSSLPEVGGQAAIYPRAQTSEAYLEAMSEIQRNESEFVARREAGFRQAATFSWQRCARETLDVYRTICSR